MSRHTPGPWQIARDSYGVERIWDAELDCDVACCEGDGSIPREIRQANAQLIVAAPELFDAANLALAALMQPKAVDLEVLEEKLRVAIGKANYRVPAPQAQIEQPKEQQ